MSTKLHSGLKRTLAWLLTAAMLAQGCFVVSADDFSSEPAAAQETQADTQSDAEAVDFDTDAVETTESSDDVTSEEDEIAAPDVQQDADVEDISHDDVDDIVEYTNEKFDYINSVRTAIKKDEVSEEEVENVRVDAVRYWRRKYKHYMGRVRLDDNDKIIERASDLLNDIRDKNIYFVEKEIESYFSNGCFYYLSDKDSEHEPQIGWRPGWEEKYKNNG